MKKLIFLTALLAAMLTLLLSGCSFDSIPPLPTPRTQEVVPPYTTAPEQAAEDLLKPVREQAFAASEALKASYYYDEAVKVLNVPELASDVLTAERISALQKEKASLVNFTGDIPHIFFHSLIVYPEMIFTDTETPMGGLNSGFSEKAELEKILPQLYERGYVLYDLDRLWVKRDGVMTRCDIMLPEGKIPLILSVDDVAYAYGDGYASRLFVDDAGQLMYNVKNPQGGTDVMPDADVMGVVDAFVREHPDFAYQGHKGTIALTGFQGAFGYDYDIPEQAEQMKTVVAALKADGWNFASHSYTHNRVNNYYGPGCSSEKIYYDINKWIAHCVPCLGETRLFIAPFGYRVQQPMLQIILDAGFEIYCTVDDKVYNELNSDYALMSRIEIGGYSMTYYRDMLNSLFFNVDEVFDDAGRPPVI